MVKHLFIFFFLLAGGSAVAQSAHKTVMAVQGDGIYSLLRNSGFDPKTYLQAFIDLNKENLSSENGLFVGRVYQLPNKDEKATPDPNDVVLPDSIDLKTVKAAVVLEKRSYEIFGPDYSTVFIESRQLEGAVFYLIAGHGGPDPGAVELHNGVMISEDEYAYDVTLRLARKLISNGALVYLITRDPDDGIRDAHILPMDQDEQTYPAQTIPRNQVLRLKQRVDAVNELYQKNTGHSYQRIIETHVDSRSIKENIDVFFYYHEDSRSGKRLADNLQTTFRQKYARYQPNRAYNGTTESRNLYIIKHSLAPTVYIEIGNLKNSYDKQRILDWENRDALAKWITDGIIRDYKDR